MKNVGQVFENTFRGDVPDYCFVHRPPNPPQSFTKNMGTSYSWKNLCDFMIFDTKNQLLLLLELKTTENTSISYEDIHEEKIKNPKMIHKHQILGLKDTLKYPNVLSGFIFNFRHEKDGTETTYYQNIADFIVMTSLLNKVSFNEKDLIKYKAVPIIGYKARTKWHWQLSDLFTNIANEYNNKQRKKAKSKTDNKEKKQNEN